MSPRKKNINKAGPSKQPTINNFFPSKSKHAPTSARPKRLAQSSLTARPLRSKRSPDPEILDLTQSTSPTRESESESPPSAKKRRLEATSPDQSPIRGAQMDLFLLAPSRSTSPDSHISQKLADTGLDSNIQPTLFSPAPSQAGRSQSMPDIDPDEIIESSQTQYLHLRFTPSSQRVVNTDPDPVPAPVFTPPARSRQQSREPLSAQKTPGLLSTPQESQSTVFIPSSQGEVSAPSTPRKRNRASLDQPGASAQTPSAIRLGTYESNTDSRPVGTPKHQQSTSTMPPPPHPAFVNTPVRNRLVTAHPFTPHFSSPRPIPSSDAPSLDATELGTVESPPKPVKYPAITTNLLPRISEVGSGSQDIPQTHQRASTPLLPISNIDPNAPRTPHRSIPHIPPSSPTDFPSPGRLLSSLGFQTSRNPDNMLPGPGSAASAAGIETQTPAHIGRNHTPGAGSPRLPEVESPVRSRSSSQTVIPSSQPMHDSSPPPDYDLDPKRHSFNQGRLQSLNQPPAPESPARFDSRFPSNSSRPYFTARTHHSPSPSSQSLPPSQSPVKGGQFDPNQSAAGIRGVFGMLGFGSEVDNHEDQTDAHQRGGDRTNPHIPITYDLPPSSPPPQTPTRYESRESSPDSYLVPASGRKGKAKRIGKTPIRDSPLARAFEAAKKRSKTATPSASRRSMSKISQIASSPIRPTHSDDMDVDSSPVRDSQSNSRLSTTKKGKTRAEPGGLETSSLTGRSRRASQATQSKATPNTRQTRLSMGPQRQKSVDQEIVESSDAEEMEIDARPPLTLPTSTRATAGAKSRSGSTKPIGDTTPGRKRSLTRDSEEPSDLQHAPMTPVREERLPSSVSPSPIRIHDSPPSRGARHSSPPLAPSENTQTQEESETPWESIRPSQSVSQVYERQLIEEFEREKRLRMEQNAEKHKANVLVEESPDVPQDEEVEDMDQAESQQQEESLDQEPARPVTISLNPRSPTGVSDGPPHPVLAHTFSTPRTRRTAEKAYYVVTPTKVIKRTPVGVTPSRKSMTPSSMAGEDDPEEEEYTYVEETFNPTESQRSFLNRILQGGSSQMG